MHNWKLIKLAIDGVCSFSIVPLRASALAGLAAIVAAVIAFSMYTVYTLIAGGMTPVGPRPSWP